MKRGVQAIIAAVSCQCLFFSCVALASLPVKYMSEGCVVGGKVFNLFQGKKQYTFDLPKGFNLSPYEGKKVMLEGDISPGDYFVPKDKTLKILGPCPAGTDNNAAAPAKPVAQPAKSTPPPQQATPQASKPAPQPQPPTQQSAKPSRSPTPYGENSISVNQPSKPAQPTTGSPTSKPGQQPATLAACKQNCQRKYDAEIQNCAGYKLGNTSQACKYPIARDLKVCLSSCK